MRLHTKSWSHNTKWWYHAENDGITKNNEKGECKILRSHAQLWCYCTKLWDHAENDVVTAQNEKVVHKYWDCVQNYGVTAQNYDIMQRMMQSPHKMKKVMRKILSLCRK